MICHLIGSDKKISFRKQLIKVYIWLHDCYEDKVSRYLTHPKRTTKINLRGREKGCFVERWLAKNSLERTETKYQLQILGKCWRVEQEKNMEAATQVSAGCSIARPCSDFILIFCQNFFIRIRRGFAAVYLPVKTAAVDEKLGFSDLIQWIAAVM